MFTRFCESLSRAITAAVAKGIVDGVAQGAQTVIGESLAPAIDVEPAKEPAKLPRGGRKKT